MQTKRVFALIGTAVSTAFIVPIVALNAENLAKANKWDNLLVELSDLPAGTYLQTIAASKWTYLGAGVAIGATITLWIWYWLSTRPAVRAREKPNYKMWMLREQWKMREAAALLADHEPLALVVSAVEEHFFQLLWEAVKKNDLLPAALYQNLKPGLKFTGPMHPDMALDRTRVLIWAEDKGFDVKALKTAKPTPVSSISGPP